MIDLTPLDVRNKRGDFKKLMRGYDPREVDVFLEIVAERLEQLVRENLQLRDRSLTLQSQVDAQTGREQAVQEALVTAQELRAGIQAQSKREADHMLKEAEVEARRLLAEAEGEVRDRLRGIERRLDQGQDALADLERRRARFLQEFRGLLQRELDVIQSEEQRAPLGARPAEKGTRSVAEPDPGPATTPVEADVPGDATAEASVPLRDVPPEVLEVSAAGGRELSEGGPVDVRDLRPEPEAQRRNAPPAAVGSEPSPLEVELMAGSGRRTPSEASTGTRGPFEGIPDLETVLAEAGVEEVRPPPPPEEFAPPAPSDRPDNLILFDPNDRDRKR